MRAATGEWMTSQQDARIVEAVAREGRRLRRFIQRHVRDQGDVEDVLQEVFSELVEAYRLMKPIEQVGAWLFRVARNRITDLFRKRRPGPLPVVPAGSEDEGRWSLEDLLPS
jgi:RNA polymerase sigma factor (sigma-70 family)